MEEADKKTAIVSKIAEKAPIDDPLSVYYLHPSDSTGAVLVSQQLNGDNYASWSRSVLIALSVKNKVGFVDGTVPKPVGEDDRLISSWNRNNNVVVSWLLNSVSKEIARSILFGDTAAQIWKDLRERFRQSNGPRVFELRHDLPNLKQGQDSISTFFTKLKAIWDELNDFKPQCESKTCNEFYNTEYGMKFLMGLNDTYTGIRGQLLLMDPIPPINKIFALCVQEERQRSIGFENHTVDTSSTMAMTMREDVKTRRQFKPKERPFCTHCKMTGHTIERCYKLHGYPPGTQQKFKTQRNSVDVKFKNDDRGDVMDNLSDSQCHRLIGMLTDHIKSSAKESTSNATVNLATFTTGSYADQGDWQG